MKDAARLGILSATIVLFVVPVRAQDSRPPGEEHHGAVDARGDHVMGFDHEKTTHHFRLTPSGGSIELSVNDRSDAGSRDAIRGHLSHIARMFSQGDFDAPMLIHDRIPPGVPTLKRRRRLIRWTYQETEGGGRIAIATKDSEALSAIHDFLRFQIADHRTGDSSAVTEEPNRARTPTGHSKN